MEKEAPSNVQAEEVELDNKFHREFLATSEVREIFGPDFFSIEEVEKFTGRAFTPEEKALAEEKWQLKIIEQGLTRKILEQLKQEGFMVVLRTETFSDGTEKGKAIKVTIENLVIKNKYTISTYDSYWYYDRKPTFKRVALEGMTWVIVKKDVLIESRGKDWDEQQNVLSSWAKSHNINEKFVRRRTPVEVAYDMAICFEVRSEKILKFYSDWTSTETSDGNFVLIGGASYEGDRLCMRVNPEYRLSHQHHIGVCPAI